MLGWGCFISLEIWCVVFCVGLLGVGRVGSCVVVWYWVVWRWV